MKDVLDGLNDEQRVAVEHDKGPMLVVAGAGTGKTQVITRRIAHLIATGKAKPHQILALTFTEKSAAEMEQRMVELMGYLHNVDLLTFNSFGENLVKRFGRDIGLASDFKLLSEIQQNIVISDNLDSFKLDYFAPVSIPDKYISDMLVYFSKLKNELVAPSKYLVFAQKLISSTTDEAEKLEAKKQLELAQAYIRYIEICRQKGFIDYDDQIVLAIEILERRPNILRLLQKELRYLMVDEFQDTNLAQNRLLELLAGASRNLMVVGDDDQSIYRFRGAAISNILAFREQYPEAKQVVLTQNYRSSQQILDAAYLLIQNNNPERLEFKNNIDKHLVAQFDAIYPIIEGVANYEMEMEWIINDIKQRQNAGLRAGDIVVLVRKNSQGIMLARAFERAKLAHRLIGQSQDLYMQVEIQFLLYFFRFLTNPNDSASLYHLLAGEVFGFDVGKLRELVDVAARRHISLEQALRDGLFEGSENEVGELVTQFDRWRELLPVRSVGEVGFVFLEETGYVRRLVNESERRPEVTLKLNHLNQFFKTLSEYERIANDKSVVGYVDHLGGLMRAGETTDAADVDMQADEVQIMTVHRAKGLEFEAVYIFDLTRGNFPSRERGGGIDLPEGLINTTEEDEGWNKREERRLMYVAMTRAKRHLAMTFSTDHGGKLPHKPSEFLTEVNGGGEIASPEKAPAGDMMQQIELFRFDNSSLALTPDFWQDNWLVLGVRQIDDYIKCPAEFRWKHILKVPERPGANMAYGSLIHKLVERYYRAILVGQPLSLEEMLGMLTTEWPQAGFFSIGVAERSLAQAKQTIELFYRREVAEPRLPRAVEDSFRAKIDEAQVIMKGRYDAVFEFDDGKIEICDYKTGGAGLSDAASAEQRAKTTDQLTMYSLAWQLMHGTIPQKLTLDFLDQGLVGSASKTAKQLEAMKQKIIKAAEGIRAGDFAPGSSCFNCSHTNLYQE